VFRECTGCSTVLVVLCFLLRESEHQRDQGRAGVEIKQSQCWSCNEDGQWTELKVGHKWRTKREKNMGWIAVDGQQSHRRSPFFFLWWPGLPPGSCCGPGVWLGAVFVWSCLLGWGVEMPLGLVKGWMQRRRWKQQRETSRAEQLKDQDKAEIKIRQSQSWVSKK
jgi:hypothetical protein